MTDFSSSRLEVGQMDYGSAYAAGDGYAKGYDILYSAGQSSYSGSTEPMADLLLVLGLAAAGTAFFVYKDFFKDYMKSSRDKDKDRESDALWKRDGEDFRRKLYGEKRSRGLLGFFTRYFK